jgi:parvulin-like peptidyl-prolyl isomerase
MLAVLVVLLGACGGKEKQAPPASPPVAVVNGMAILPAEFEKALAEEMALTRGETPLTAEELEELKEAVLETLVRERLLLKRARDLALDVDGAELAARIDEIKRDYGPEPFAALFGAGRIDYDAWQEALRRRVLFEKLVARDVNDGIRVSDEEAQKHFNANRRSYAVEKRVRLAQIVLPDQTRAEGVLKRLKAGEDFDKVAREVSIGPEAARGGDLGFVEPEALPEAIDRVVFSMPAGRVSQVVQSPYGFHIFKVLAREGAAGRTFSGVKERVVADLRKMKEAEAYRNWIDGLRARAEININLPLPGGAAPAEGGAGEKGSPAAPKAAGAPAAPAKP